MSLQIVVEPEAELDIADAHRWYEEQRAGLGIEFTRAVNERLLALSDFPDSSSPGKNGSRVALVRRFPYLICFVVEAGTLAVVGVFHGHRDPKSWGSRIDSR